MSRLGASANCLHRQLAAAFIDDPQAPRSEASVPAPRIVLLRTCPEITRKHVHKSQSRRAPAMATARCVALLLKARGSAGFTSKTSRRLQRSSLHACALEPYRILTSKNLRGAKQSEIHVRVHTRSLDTCMYTIPGMVQTQ